jgi:DNA-binding Xre family transcriptional regulator
MPRFVSQRSPEDIASECMELAANETNPARRRDYLLMAEAFRKSRRHNDRAATPAGNNHQHHHGPRIREVREYRGHSQQWLAEHTRISPKTLSHYETGKIVNIPGVFFLRAARALDCRPEDLRAPPGSSLPPRRRPRRSRLAA